MRDYVKRLHITKLLPIKGYMKPQDIAFLILVILIVLFKKQWYIPVIASVFIAAAMPLFAWWIFFTAERFVWYAVCLMVLYLSEQLWRYKRSVRT